MPEEVISDTSPIQYLYQAECLDLLPQLYGSLTVPHGVAQEIAIGREQGISLPDLSELAWLRLQAAPALPALLQTADLGLGEREVLALAADRPTARVLLDERLARHFAKRLEIPYTGTLGVLLRAKKKGHLPAVRPLIDRLQELGFWLAAATRRAVLEIAGEG